MQSNLTRVQVAGTIGLFGLLFAGFGMGEGLWQVSSYPELSIPLAFLSLHTLVLSQIARTLILKKSGSRFLIGLFSGSACLSIFASLTASGSIELGVCNLTTPEVIFDSWLISLALFGCSALCSLCAFAGWLSKLITRLADGTVSELFNLCAVFFTCCRRASFRSRYAVGRRVLRRFL